MYYKRDLENKIERYLDSPEIIAIFGPRQVGKTTLLREFYARVHNPIFITFEDIELKVLFEEDIKSFIALYIEPYDHIFIDEFQYAKMGGKHLKYIHDTTEKKIFISGSSAMELSIHAIKYLAGRIFVFTLYSFSFSEFLRVKDATLHKLYTSSNISAPIAQKIYRYLDEYISYGGYPRVVLSKSNEEREEVLKNLLSIYLLRDIKEIAKISDETKMYKLLKALSLQVANVVVYSELAKLVGVNVVQLKEYLSVFEKAFLIQTITPFFTNKQLEIVKNPEVFFLDMGLRNAIIKNFSTLDNRVDKGAMLENFVFRELVEQELKYYRTKNGAEVDFI
ncbi:MAG: ATP-binding protein, partial [Campylobacterota bacterium]|nr:ATP-binding protein [Campylobacterota bacterium]